MDDFECCSARKRCDELLAVARVQGRSKRPLMRQRFPSSPVPDVVEILQIFTSRNHCKEITTFRGPSLLLVAALVGHMENARRVCE